MQSNTPASTKELMNTLFQQFQKMEDSIKILTNQVQENEQIPNIEQQMTPEIKELVDTVNELKQENCKLNSQLQQLNQ